MSTSRALRVPRCVRTGLAVAAAATLAAPLAVGPTPAHSSGHDTTLERTRSRASGVAETLPLGPSTLQETRTTRRIADGVTHTHIVRGGADGSLPWVVEFNIPAGPASPDPASPPRSVQDRAAADALAKAVTDAGHEATVQPVHQPAVADVAEHVLGYRVRLAQSFVTKAQADAAVTAAERLGFSSRSWYSGWDGQTSANGPWNVHVLTIDPKTFSGTLTGTYGEDLENRETTSALVAFEKALAGVNAGFFVMDPKAGAEGDPAGIAVYEGKFVSEPVGNRPALVLREDAAQTTVTRPAWAGTLRWGRNSVSLDGINRVPGLIRNCGGENDRPTDRPKHDVTCADDDEVITFTPEFGRRTPAGAGAEAVLNTQGEVVAVHNTRGVELEQGQTSVQGIGENAATVASMRPGTTVLSKNVVNLGVPITERTTVVNGGPQLVKDGREHITQREDGMVHDDNPSFDYGWVLQRNPRTIAGVDRAGRTVLITVDGRQEESLGLSIPEAADVARAFGLRHAINLDGGGSTTMVVEGRVINRTSDATGERPVGDAIVIR